MGINEIVSNIPILAACILCFLGLVQITILGYKHKGNILEDLRGKDKIWQFVELTGVIWLILFPVVVVAGVLLAIGGYEIPTAIWATMDFVYAANLGGKFGKDWLNKKHNEEKKENTTINEQI